VSQEKNSKVALFSLAGWAVVCLCLYRFWSYCHLTIFEVFDLGWLIQTGAHIATKGIPHSDIFSWTFPERSFTAYQWLAELCLNSLYKAGGLWLIGLTACYIAGFIYLLILPAVWFNLGIRAPIVFGVACLILTPHFFNARPQLFSYFFLLLTVLIFEYGKSNKNRIFLLLPIFALWANLHSFFLVGLLIASVYLSFNFKEFGIWRSLVCGLLCVSCVLLNPYGIGLFEYLKTFVDGTQFLDIREVLPSWTDPSATLWFIYLLLCWTALICGRKKISKSGLLVCLILSVMALFVRRYQSIAVVVTWLYFGQALSCFKWALTPTSNAKKSGIIACSLIALIFPGIAWVKNFPSQAKANEVFYEKNEVILDIFHQLQSHYRGFCDPATGSWLIAKNYLPVFVDTRYDMYPKAFCKSVVKILKADISWKSLLEAHQAKTILVRDEYPLQAKLEEDEEWFPVVDNGRLTIWISTKEIHSENELAFLHLQNAFLKQTLKEKGAESSGLESAKTRCRWYFKTSFKASKDIAREKIKLALTLLPKEKQLNSRWRVLNNCIEP
jgi:hypothetical protein